jgi:hypothetical protein
MPAFWRAQAQLGGHHVARAAMSAMLRAGVILLGRAGSAWATRSVLGNLLNQRSAQC